MTAFDWSVITRNIQWLWAGMQLTLLLTVLAVVGGMAVGIILAGCRLSSLWILSNAAKLYVNIFRSIPLVLAVFWFYFLVPVVTGYPVGPFYSVLIAFVFFEGAYFAEIVRSGIQGVRGGQLSAALSTGLSHFQAMRFVIMPQALRSMYPILVTRSIIIFQDTSLAFVVGLTDFLTSANIIANREGRPIEVYCFVALIYFVLCYGAELGLDLSKRRGAIR
jgi:glutamate/aspartate transport system permease protein